jgi:biotin carboxyl carrier protein
MKYIIEIDGKIHEVEIEEQESSYLVTCDGVLYHAHIEEKQDTSPVHTQSPVTSPAPFIQPVGPPGPPQEVPLSGTITAPMPGTIMKVTVSPGAAVQAGDLLLTLEAMKMENEITSPSTGVVKQILVKEGQTVNAGDPLIQMG